MLTKIPYRRPQPFEANGEPFRAQVSLRQACYFEAGG